MPTAPLPFVLCADDYGLAPGVGRGIRALIDQGRLSATSCMTAGPFWAAEAALLRPLADRADIGLHFTLTDQAPVGPMPRLAPGGKLPMIGQLMKLAYTGVLHRDEIQAELDRQLSAFTAAMGNPPAYIDGHQHVHLLPTVRDVVTDALKALPGAYVRLCDDTPLALLSRGVAVPKAALLAMMSRGLRRRSRQAAIAGNRGFRGVYDLTNRVPFAELMRRFVKHPGAGMLVMVHPGEVDDALRAVDTVTDQRERELAYLAGPEFAALLSEAGLAPARFTEC